LMIIIINTFIVMMEGSDHDPKYLFS